MVVERLVEDGEPIPKGIPVSDRPVVAVPVW